jgi:DNA mismatch repair protein MSH6
LGLKSFERCLIIFFFPFQRLEDLRKDYSRKLGCKIVFKDLGKELFQLEVPAKTKTPSSWVQMSKTQSVARYWSDDVRELVKEFLEAREIRDEALRSVKGRLYAKFDAQYSQW